MRIKDYLRQAAFLNGEHLLMMKLEGKNYINKDKVKIQ